MIWRLNDRLKDFLALDPVTKTKKANAMVLTDSSDIASIVTRRGDVSFQPLRHGAEEIVFASRDVPREKMLGTLEFQRIHSEMGELAAALNCHEHDAEIKLLRVEYFFYYADKHQFLFAQKPPYKTLSMMNLEQLISGDPVPRTESSLGERMNLAYKIAEAVFFLHLRNIRTKTSHRLVS